MGENNNQKKDKLINSAIELFIQNGYQKTSIEMIVEKSGMSIGSFYLHFKSKIELYRTLYSEAVDILNSILNETALWPGMTNVSRISALAASYLRFYKEYRGYYQIFAIIYIGQQDFTSNRELQEIMIQKAINNLKMIEGVLKDGVKTGELKEMDTWKAANALWGMMDGVIMQDVRGNTEIFGGSLNDLYMQGLEIIINGMIR